MEENMEQMGGHPTFEELLQSSREYQSAFDRKVDKALQTARTNWEREREAGRERELDRARAAAEAEYQGRMKELDAREADYARRMRQIAVADRLVGMGLPSQFAPWLTAETDEESFARLEAFDTAFRAGVSDAVTARMAGFAPAEPVHAPALDRETIRGMSPREINAHWAEIQHTLKG